MDEKSTFDDLAGSLSERERLELLERINRSMFIVDDEEETIKRKDLTQKERELIIQRDLERLPFFRRLLLSLRSKITGKSKTENFLQYKVKMLKKQVMKMDSGLTGFETRDLTPKFAESVFSVYAAIIPVRELYKKLWMKKGAFEGAVMYMLQNRMEQVNLKLEDVMSLDELVDEYAKHGKKESLRSIAVDKLQKYIEGFPEELFSQVEDGMLPIYYLKELVLFPYISFFSLFHFNPQFGDADKKPIFKSASAVLALEYLEKLYYAVYIATKIEDPAMLDRRILDYCFELDSIEDEENKNKEKEEQKENEEDGRMNYVQGLLEAINDVHAKVKVFNQHIPLSDLIRYFSKDPYFQLIFYIPKLHLKDIYYQIMKGKIQIELEERFQELQKLYIQREIDDIFRGKNMITFHNYREYASIDYKKMGVPFFVHTRSLNLLYNFVRLIYRDNIINIVQMLQKGILAQNRITQDRLMRHATDLEEVEEKIKQFDFSLSPESDDGKSFQRLRFMLASDPGQQRMYKTLVLQKERTVKSLITMGEEAVEGLRKIFDEILSSPADTIKAQLNNHYLIKGKPTLLSSAIRDRVQTLSRVRNLLSQLFKIEQG